MLIPALIGLAFKSSSNWSENIPKIPTQHQRLIALELKELLPLIDETLVIAELYFNALEGSQRDRIDMLMLEVVSDVRELRELLRESKTRWVMSLTLKIRRKVEKIPRWLTHLAYHSWIPTYQSELAVIREKYDTLIMKDSLLRDILAFISAYCITRWKWTEDLITKTTSKVDRTIRK